MGVLGGRQRVRGSVWVCRGGCGRSLGGSGIFLRGSDVIDDPQGPQECTIQPLSSGIPTIVIAIAIAIAIAVAVVIVIAMAIAVAVVIAVDALAETELILALFDTGEDRVVNA